MTGHFIVCGLGRIGYRIVTLLLQMGEAVTVVTTDVREEWAAKLQQRGVTIVRGDARNERLLIQAGIREARALIAAIDKDIVNIEIALDAKKLRPDLPIVARIFDTNLAHQMEVAFDLRRALEISTLAAPIFAASAMGEQLVASFRLDNTLLVVGRLTLTADSRLAGCTVQQVCARYGLSTLTRDRKTTPSAREIAPPLETQLQTGDSLTLIGLSSQWEEVANETDTSGEYRIGSPQRRKRAGFWREGLHPRAWFALLRHLWDSTSAPLRTIFVILNILIVLSAGVFHALMNLSPLDAVYFTLATVTTVGYGDITPKPSQTAAKVYCCFVMLLGSATVATLFSILTEYIVTSRFLQLLGRQRVPKEGHFVVVGLGNVGYRIVEKLRLLGAEVVVVEQNANREFVDAVRATTPVIIGNGGLPQTLQKANITKARAVLAVTNDDAVNLGIMLEVKQSAPQARTITRVFDADLARKVQTAFHVDASFGASLVAAPTFVAAACYPFVRNAFVLDDLLFSILDRPVGTEWEGKTPSTLRSDNETSVLMRRRPGTAEFIAASDDAPLDRDERILAVVWRRLTPDPV